LEKAHPDRSSRSSRRRRRRREDEFETAPEAPGRLVMEDEVRVKAARVAGMKCGQGPGSEILSLLNVSGPPDLDIQSTYDTYNTYVQDVPWRVRT
jgi:hypothetical protein